ncbi:MAG: hypothetical protein WCG94_00765 [Methanothrix sp.]
MSKARKLGFIPADAILDEIPGEQVFLPESSPRRSNFLEVWLNKSALNPLIGPVCEKYGVTLVSVNGRASEDAIKALYQRCDSSTIILCFADLSSSSAFFCQDLATKIAESKPSGSNADIRVKCIALKPDQIMELKIPLVQGSIDSKEIQERFKRYLKSHSFDPKKMAELDAQEGPRASPHNFLCCWCLWRCFFFWETARGCYARVESGSLNAGKAWVRGRFRAGDSVAETEKPRPWGKTRSMTGALAQDLKKCTVL